MFNKFSGEAKTTGLGTLRLTSVDVSRMPLEWKTSDLDRMNQMIDLIWLLIQSVKNIYNTIRKNVNMNRVFNDIKVLLLTLGVLIYLGYVKMYTHTHTQNS